MNRPDKAGEPSMEEILASIRQIIADEPSDRTDSPFEANPLVPSSASPPAGRKSEAPKPDGALGAPLVDRLSGVLKNGPLPPTSPLGAKRPLGFDQDLADMFEEPDPAVDSAVPTPKPDIRVAPEFTAPLASAKPAPAGDGGTPPADGAAALPPQLQPAAPVVPPMPFGAAAERAETPAAPPPKTFGFPPLRKASFYPPQPKTPPAPVAPAADAAAKADAGEAPLGTGAGLGAPAPATAAADSAVPRAGFIPAGFAVNGAAVAAPSPAAAAPPAASEGRSAEASFTPTPPAAETPSYTPDPVTRIEAAQALDALAQGLAASAASAASAAAQPAAIPLTPIAEPADANRRAPSLSGALTPAPGPAPSRTLEDAVADMLRPMLQQWVSDNMPRIIERALRVEVGRTTKPGPDSSGS